MITKNFKRTDGTDGISYKPEAKDVIIAKASTIYVSEPRAVIVDKDKETERAVNIINRGIQAIWNNGTEDIEIFVTLTEGQSKVLSKIPDLMDKSITFENYDSKNWGKLVGARVSK